MAAHLRNHHVDTHEKGARNLSINAIIVGATIVLSIVNGKGGSGKSPTAVQLAFALARMGYKVLFCDLDQQGSASFHFLGFKFKRTQPTIYNALKDLVYVDPMTPIASLPTLHLLPAHDELSGLEIDLPGKKGLFWQGRLSDMLNLYPGYDFVVTDTPGSAVSIFPTMSLTSADLAIVPTKTEIVYVVGTQDTINLIDDVKGMPGQKRSLNSDLTLWGILPCQYEVNTGSHNDAIRLLGDLYGKKGVSIYSQPSRKTTLYNEASERHIDIRDTDPTKGPILGAYWDAIADDIVKRSVNIIERNQRT
jgi:chromosome partitioning protein